MDALSPPVPQGALGLSPLQVLTWDVSETLCLHFGRLKATGAALLGVVGTPPDCSGVRGCRWPRCPHGLPRHRRAVPLLGECGPSALPLGSAGVFEVRRAPPRTSDAAPSAYSGRRGAVAAAAPEPRFFFRTNPPERLRDFPTRGWILSLAREEGNREEEGGDTRSITRPGLPKGGGCVGPFPGYGGCPVSTSGNPSVSLSVSF